MDFSRESLKGLLDIFVLHALRSEPKHGYRVAKDINALADGELELQDGTLYPILHRLEKKALILGEWVEDGTRRKRKDYRITAAGLDLLRDHASQWRVLSKILNQVVGDIS